MCSLRCVACNEARRRNGLDADNRTVQASEVNLFMFMYTRCSACMCRKKADVNLLPCCCLSHPLLLADSTRRWNGRAQVRKRCRMCVILKSDLDFTSGMTVTLLGPLGPVLMRFGPSVLRAFQAPQLNVGQCP